LKLSGKDISTTTEILKEFFAMPDRLIYNMPEKERYNKIYDYLSELTKQGRAFSIGELKINGEKCYGFDFKDGLYIIPLMFVEGDSLLENNKSDERVVVAFRKAN
jgi:hypothetical protein